MTTTNQDFRDELQAALGGAITLERELEGGAMSRVFLARDAVLRRRIVIKVLPPDPAARIDFERFRREIDFAATLQHPHIVPLLTASATGGKPPQASASHDSAGDHLLYYTMPFVEGESLRSLLASQPRLTVARALRIAAEVADALACAHRHGIVHRDIKPGNILLSGDHALVTDFGIARAITCATGDNHPTARTLTEPGCAVGSPAYMSPEQAAGEMDLDARSDVYSLGCVLYEMLTGQPPFTGTQYEVLADRLIGPPPRPTRLRPDIPYTVERVVVRALAPRAADRYATAAEFKDALEGCTTSRPPTAKRRFTRSAAAVALATAVAGALYLVHTAPPPTLDSDLIAVAPFAVLARDPELTVWGEGMSVVLSDNLDGAGPLRTVPPSRFLDHSTTPSDPASAAALARATGARFVIFGNLLPLGADSARLTATVYDADRGRTIDEVSLDARDPARHMARLSDSLSMALLNILGRVRVIGAVRHVPLGAAVPLPALKAYLEGEHFFRHGAWDSALAAYLRVVDADRTFVLALSRIGRVLGWQRIAADSLANAYALRAGTLNHGLGPHDSLLVLADSLSAALQQPGPAPDAVRWTLARRLFATVNTVSTRYPDDPLAWYEVGEARMHSGGSLGITERQALRAFDRAIALDSAFSPAYVHPFELALELDGVAAARSYVIPYLAQAPTDNNAAGARLLAVLLTDQGAGSLAARRLLDTASADAMFHAWLPARRWTDSSETAVRLLRLLVAGGRASTYGVFRDSTWLRGRLASELAFRGHLHEAYTTAHDGDPRLLSELALLGVVPDTTARATFARWLRTSTDSALWALPWWTAKRDTTSIRALVRYADAALARSHSPAQPHTRAGFAAAAGRAYLALARHDTAGALSRFQRLPDSLCVDCYFHWLTTAQLLVATGQSDAATRWLERWYTFPSRPYPTEVLWSLLRATTADRTGDHERAARAYCVVLTAWQHADPVLTPLVRQAAAGLARQGTRQAIPSAAAHAGGCRLPAAT